MRKVLVLIILLLFNIAFLYGINYTNSIMEENNFMIYFKDKPQVIDNIDDYVEDELTDYEGEDVDSVTSKLEKYFDKTDLYDYAKFIAEKSIKKGVNPYLIAGIVYESTSCKNECSILFKECNNVAMIKDKPGCFGGSYKAYNSVNDSILDVIDRVKNNYETKEDQIPYKIYKLFGKNSSWAFKVSNFMEEMKRKK